MTTAYWRHKERVYSTVDSNWDLKQAVLIQVIYNQYKELQSFKQRYKNLEHCESQLKAIFDTFFDFL